MEENQVPRLDKITEVGETPFQVIEVKEKILGGWDSVRHRGVYLFKTDTGAWGYYDNETHQVIEISQWKGKAAWMNEKWIKMSVYYRIHVVFASAVTFTTYDPSSKQNMKISWSEALIKVSDSTYLMLTNMIQGRDPNTFYRFHFAEKKKKGGGSMPLVDSVNLVG
jgi:hypothetical protein